MGTVVVSSLSRGSGKTALAAAMAARFGAEHPTTLAKSAPDDKQDAGFAELAELLPKVAVKDGGATAKPRRGGVSIIEGNSGDHAANLALAEKLDGNVVAVIKHGEQPAKLLEAYKDRLAGVVINRVAQYRQWEMENAAAELKKAGISMLGWLPEDRTLLAPDLGSVVEHLDGEYLLGEDQGQRLIKSYLLGGLVLDWGPFYFRSREGAGVLVRGDRPDVQLAALQSGAARALILTKGVNPIEYVYYEARTKGVPLVRVKQSTEAAAKALGELPFPSRFGSQEKLERIVRLAEERLDLEALDNLALKPATR